MSEARWSFTGPLTTVTNAYGDVQVTGALPTEPASFHAALAPIVAGASRGVWLRLPWDAAHARLLPTAHALGFTAAHHAADNWLTLQAWRSAAPNVTPGFACTDVGAGAFVVNADGRLLAIREQFDASGRWHTPGGHVDAGEDVVSAGAREAREETGVSCVPLGVVGWRQLLLPMAPPPGTSLASSAEELERQVQNCRFGTTNLAVYVLCIAGDDALQPDPAEVSEATWLAPADFVSGAHDAEAVYARCMLESGLLAAATQAARRLRDASSGRSGGGSGSGGGAAAASATPLPCSTSPEVDERRRGGHVELPCFTTAYTVMTSHRRWGAAAAYPAHWFNAFAPDVFTAAVSALPSTLSVARAGDVQLPPAAPPAASSGGRSAGKASAQQQGRTAGSWARAAAAAALAQRPGATALGAALVLVAVAAASFAAGRASAAPGAGGRVFQQR